MPTHLLATTFSSPPASPIFFSPWELFLVLGIALLVGVMIGASAAVLTCRRKWIKSVCRVAGPWVARDALQHLEGCTLTEASLSVQEATRINFKA